MTPAGPEAPLMMRPERPEDVGAIRAVNEEAFGQPQEAQLVDALRERGGVLLSLVAIADGRVVGHALFTPVTIGDHGEEVVGAGLGPMAVQPEYQRQGIGGRLIAEGRRILDEAGCPFVVVVGHPEYYPRFGFRPAASRGIRCEWEVPDEAFMILALADSGMNEVTGVARYRPEFSEFA